MGRQEKSPLRSSTCSARMLATFPAPGVRLTGVVLRYDGPSEAALPPGITASAEIEKVAPME